GRSAVHFGHPRQNYQVSAPVSAFKGGPSASMDRTVRSSFWTSNRAKNGSVRAQTRLRRTVRRSRADRPQVYFQQKCTSVKRPYLLAPMSKLGDLGLYGKLIQRATQPN